MASIETAEKPIVNRPWRRPLPLKFTEPISYGPYVGLVDGSGGWDLVRHGGLSGGLSTTRLEFWTGIFTVQFYQVLSFLNQAVNHNFTGTFLNGILTGNFNRKV